MTRVAAPDPIRPRAVLFACGLNAVRSPMAAGLARKMLPALRVASAGVRKGDLDPFAVAAMAEIGIDIAEHQPMTFEELEDWDDLDFDLIVTLAPEAHHKALEIASGFAVDVEYRPTPDPSLTSGNREQILDAYRAVRDRLFAKIKTRFGLGGGLSV
jgi:protein-tyrosine-phosphatase